MGKVLTITQRKGGSGKSTIIASIAADLAGRGYSVGLLDTDKQRSSAKWYKRREMKQPDAPAIEFQYVNGNVKDTVLAMRERNDFLLVDTAGFASTELRIALTLTDLALCPFRPKQYDLDVAKELRGIISEIQIVNPKLIVAAVLNSCPSNVKDKRANDAQAYLENYKYSVCRSRIGNREAYGDAGQVGLGVTEFNDPKAKDEITNLVTEIFL